MANIYRFLLEMALLHFLDSLYFCNRQFRWVFVALMKKRFKFIIGLGISQFFMKDKTKTKT